jgi:hypothetical protein
LRAAGIFVLKCLVFSIILCAVWYVTFTPRGGSSNSQRDESAVLMKKYWDQAALADKLQATYMEQQRRATIQMEKQEELLTRWEKVIQKWEKSGAQR